MQTTTQLKAPPTTTHSMLAKTRQRMIAAPTVNGSEMPVLDTQPGKNVRANHSFGAISVFPPDPLIQPKRITGLGHRLPAFNVHLQRKVNPIPVLPASWAVRPPVQAKLTVGPANDQYEQEADRVADQVMRMSESRVQAKCACGGEAGADGECAACQAKRLEVQRRLQLKSQEEEEVVQAKPDQAATDATPALESRLNSSRGSGRALPEDTRSTIESAFGVDFGGVRVHTGNEAVQMNKELSAQAFTHGSDIYFNAGKYEPGSQEGKGLLAHELTHVVQQNGEAMQRQSDPEEAKPHKAPIQKRSLRKINTTTEPVLQRLPVRTTLERKQQLKAFMSQRGRNNWTDALDEKIGSSTIVEEVGLPRLFTMLERYNWNVDIVSKVLNEATLAEVHNINVDTGEIPASFFRLGELTLPNEGEIERSYTNYLRVENPPYNPTMFTTFRNNMRANGGQYWDFSAHQFRRLSEGFRNVYTNAPIAGAAFSATIYAGNNVDFANHTTVPVANWGFNPALAIGYELRAALQPLAVPVGYGRPFTPAMRAAVAEIHAQPQAAQAIINLGGGVAARLNTLMDAVSASATPAEMLDVLALVLAPPVGVAHPPGFLTALNHINELAEAQPRLNPMTAGMPFGNRAGGLRQHFTKHPLGVQAAAHIATATWESLQWMNILNLAPNGLITRGNFANLPRYSREEWEIFAQHAHTYKWYYYWHYNSVNNGSQPTNNAERDALITYLQNNAPAPPENAGANANSIAAAHENVYQTHVSNQFDGAAPNRYLCWDAGNLKVMAMAGNLFMVAAWNGAGNFDLSSSFLINGGAAAQFANNLPTKIMDV